MKKFLSLLLITIMLFSTLINILPSTAFAESSGAYWYYGDYYEGSPYTIYLCGNGTIDLREIDWESYQSIVIEDGVTVVGEAGVNAIYSFNRGVLTISGTGSTYFFHGHWQDWSRWSDKITKYVFNEGITEIEEDTVIGENVTSVVLPRSLAVMDTAWNGVFNLTPNLTDVYYRGTEEEWNNVKMGAGSAHIEGVTMHYNYGSTNTTNSTSDMKSYAQEAGISYGDYYYNIFTQYATIAKDDSTEMMFSANVITNGESHSNLKMYLTQGPDKMLPVDTWAKTPIKPGEFFEADRKIYLLLQNTATGQSSSKLTKLKVVSENIKNDVIWEQDDVDEKFSFKLGNMISFTIPDTVPVFGGAEVGMDLDFIPISVEYAHPDKLNIVFGTEIASQKGEKDRVWGDVKYFKDFSFENYKKDFKKAISKSNRSIKQLRNDYKMTNKVPLKSFKNISGNVDVAGYAEMKYINGQWRFVEGMLGLDAEIGYKYQGNNVIYFIPITYSIGGNVGAGIDGVMKNLSADTFTPQFEGYLNGRISATIGGGIGASFAKLVYADGTGTLNVRKSLNDEYLKSWVDAHADFVVCEVGFFALLRKTFAQGEWLIYETGNPDGLIPYNTMSLMSINDIYSNYDKDTVYEFTPRNEEETTWLGDSAPISLFEAEYTGQDAKLLSENVYYSAEPQIDFINGKKVMVWVSDNKDRDIYNKTMLVYSIYDESSDTWSAPLAVSDDGTSDTYPNFNNGYVVWQNNNSMMDENTTISGYAKDCDICIAKFNGTGFDEAIKVTDNQIMDSMPMVFADENGVNVVWITNTENDILGTTGKNSIYFKKLGETEQIIEDNLNAITSLSLGNINNEVSIAYSFDEDNDLATIDDRDIYVYSDGNTINLNNDDIINSNPLFSGNKLYWYSDNNIEYTSDLSTVNQMFNSTGISTDQFNVYTNNNGKSAVFWTESDETATEVYVSLFENNKWSNPIKLTDLNIKIKSPHGILDGNGNIAVSFTDIAVDGENIIANLYVLDAIPSYDISVANVEFNENNLVENSDFPISVDVVNDGEKDINEYQITISDGHGVNNTYTFSDKLKAGTAVTQTIQYSVPTTMSKQTISISVTITDGEEFDVSNNSCDLILGNERISLSKIELHEAGERYQIISEIINEGFADSPDITVNLRKDSVDGTIIHKRYISSLSSQGSSEIVFDEPIAGIEYEDGIKKLYVTVECNDSVEDSEYVLLQEMQADKEFEQMIVLTNYNSDTKILNSNAIVTNNTDTKQDFVMIFAVYDGDRLLGIDYSDGSVLPYNETSVDGFVSLSDYKTQYTVRSFLWQDLEKIMPLCEKDEYLQ